MSTERYVVESLIVHTADHATVLIVHACREKAGRKSGEDYLAIQGGARVLVNGHAATWHYLIGWLMEAKGVTVEVDRDEARFGSITEARFSAGGES